MRRGSLFLALSMVFLIISSLASGAVLAQTSTITITSPTNGDTINLTTPVGVTGLTGTPPVGAQVTVTLFSGATAVGSLTVPVGGTGSWSANVPFSIMPPEFSDGAVRAELLDASLIVVAVDQIGVTWGAGPAPTPTSEPPTATPTLPPPTATPTATATLAPPTATPTATATIPGTFVTVLTPTNGQIINPELPVTVTGNASFPMPVGATVMVRIRTLGGVTLGEQGIVPDAFGNFNVPVSVNPASVNTGDQAQIVAFHIYNGTILATSNIVTITWQKSTTATVVITSPINGANIGTAAQVMVSGTHLNLPAGSVIRAQAYIGGGATFVGEGVVTPGPGGAWTAAITLNTAIANGTPGIIRALVQMGSGIIATSNTVNITWVSSGAPVLLINSPTQDSLVAIGGAAIPVSGFAANIPGPLTVRAVDALGGVLSQQIVAINPNGSWQAVLAVNIVPGARGGIIAISSNPQLSARVNVTYGAQCMPRIDWFIYIVQPGDTLNRIASRTGSTAAELAYANCIANADLLYVGQQLRIPRQPVVTFTPTLRPPTATPTPLPSALSVRIDSPAANSSIGTDDPVIVRGGGTNLAGRDLTIRALDNQRRLLAQGSARADNNSSWQAALAGIVVTEPTPGIIVAFVRSGSGVILGSATLQVIFQPTGVISPDGSAGIQRLIITTPVDGDRFSETGQSFVIGTVSGGYTGEIRVRVLDPLGLVIDEQPAELTPLNEAGDSLWQAALNINAISGTYGIVFAYAPSPMGLDPSLTDAAYILFGTEDQQPYVTITTPSPYTTISLGAPLIVRGQGGRLFEGNVVVRLLSDDGGILAETATVVNAPDAGTGGEGPWETLLTFDAAPGTRGTIVAFSTSPQDGSIVAFASINVVLGEPEAAPNFVAIQTPLMGSPIRNGEPLLIAGIADGANGNRVRVSLFDENGGTLLQEIRTITPQSDGVGVWQIVIELSGLQPGAALTIRAETLASASDAVLDADVIGVQVSIPQA